MSSVKEIDLGLKDASDELFMNDKGRIENRLPKIYGWIIVNKVEK